MGNVTADAELTYEYGVRNTSKKTKSPSAGASPSPKDASSSPKGASSSPKGATASPKPAKGVKVPPLTLEGKPHLPFQLQIEYTGRDGSRCLRVITEAKQMTKDRSRAERGEGGRGGRERMEGGKERKGRRGRDGEGERKGRREGGREGFWRSCDQMTATCGETLDQIREHY